MRTKESEVERKSHKTERTRAEVKADLDLARGAKEKAKADLEAARNVESDILGELVANFGAGPHKLYGATVMVRKTGAKEDGKPARYSMQAAEIPETDFA